MLGSATAFSLARRFSPEEDSAATPSAFVITLPSAGHVDALAGWRESLDAMPRLDVGLALASPRKPAKAISTTADHAAVVTVAGLGGLNACEARHLGVGSP
jgi:hypothetical protein